MSEAARSTTQRWTAVVAFMLAIVVKAPAAWGWNDADRASAPARIEIPLRDGRIDIQATIRRMYEAAGLDPAHADWLENLPRLPEAVQKMHLESLSELTDGAVAFNVNDESVTLTIDSARIKAAAEQARQSVAGWIQMQLQGPGGVAPPFGITMVGAQGELVPLADAGVLPRKMIIVLHGLDDSGWIFRDVIGALRDSGCQVARFDYPNDGPIAESADLFAADLVRLKQGGVTHVDLVAHSMGGLVCRDALTRSAHYAGDGRGNENLPALGAFIMLGTPNHGSHMARLQEIAEIGEHLSKLFQGESCSFRLLGDGGGEAAIDLLPDSDFLRRLNARPPIQHVEISIIAGRISPLEDSQVDTWISKVHDVAKSDRAPQWLRDLAGRDEADLVGKKIGAAVRGLGDGVVSIDSARLEGVDDFTIVEGDHIGMLMNVIKSSRVPPAVPLILERVECDGDGGKDRPRE